MKKFILIAITLFATVSVEAAPPQLDPSTLMAVHLTDVLPEDGLMIPGVASFKIADKNNTPLLSSQDSLEVMSNTPLTRPTLHWCLGGPVKKTYHEGVIQEWSGRRYAIIEPFGCVLPESLGGSIQDWATFGPHQLSRKVVIIAPKADQNKKFPGRVIFYDDAQMNVREAVTRHLIKENLPQLEMDFATKTHHLMDRSEVFCFLQRVHALSATEPKSALIDCFYKASHETSVEQVHKDLFEKVVLDQQTPNFFSDDFESQLLIVGDQKVKLCEYFKNVFLRYPGLKWMKADDFPTAEFELLARKLFMPLVQFQYYIRMPQEKQDLKNLLYLEFVKEESAASLESKIKDVKDELAKIEAALPASIKKAADLWLKGIRIWLKYLSNHRVACLKKGKPFYSQPSNGVQKHINNVIATVNKHSIAPMMALFRPFSFLTQKYPALVQEAEEPFQLRKTEDHYAWYMKNGGKERFLNTLARCFACNVFDSANVQAHVNVSAAFCKRVFNKQIDVMASQHARNGFFECFFERIKTEREISEDLLLAGEYLYQFVEDKGDESVQVLFLGRSPSFVQLAYEKVLKAMGNTRQKHVHVNFSGHADLDSIRPYPTFKNNKDLHRIRNMVSQEKLSHFLDYLSTKNLDEAKTLYIVDIIGSGAGLNSFIQLLRQYYKAQNIEFPTIKMILLSDFYSIDDRAANRPFEVKPKNGRELNEWEISFKRNTENNLADLTLDLVVIPLSPLTVNMIVDNDAVQHLGVKGIYYPPQKWAVAHDEEREKGGVWHDELYEIAGEKFDEHLAKHLKAFDIQSLN